ncbi:MAG: VOC family protein [Dehalococcoidia bacterium]
MPDFDWPRPVVAFQIQARDRDKQEAFYREMFDWDITRDAAIPVSLIPPGKGPPVEGVGGVLVQNERSAFAVFIQVADLGESMKKAEELGGKSIFGPIDVPGGPTIAQIEDPEGNLVGLVQM